MGIEGWKAFIPIVGAIVTLYLYFKLCQSFGYGLMFLIGFLVLNPIFCTHSICYLIL